MKTRYMLEGFRDESTGEIGLGIIGVARDETTNAAHHGLLIAHDIVEHVNGFDGIGNIDDELEALGAIWYVRGQHGELTRDGSGSRYSPAENIANDVVRMFRDHKEGGQHVSYLPWKATHCLADDAIDEILRYADGSWKDEVSGGETRITALEWLDYRAQAMMRMRKGYSRARRRWQRRGQFAANNLFWEIANAVQPHCKGCIEGIRLELRINRSTLTATCIEEWE